MLGDLTGAVTAGLVGAASVTWAQRSPSSTTRLPAAVLAAGGLFAVLAASRLSTAGDALADLPAWFALATVGAGLATAVALARLVRAGRGIEGLALGATGVLAAAAALPDVEVLVALAALWGPWVLVAWLRTPVDAPARRAVPWWLGGAVGAVGGALVCLALVDGARGRPGSVLVAPVVVAPMAAAAAVAHRWSRGAVRVWLVVTFAVGVAVARHAALGAGTARPLIGSAVGSLAVIAAMLAAQRWLSGEPADA